MRTIGVGQFDPNQFDPSQFDATSERDFASALHFQHHSKFEVQDADGVYRDYSAQLNTDWFTGASIAESIDQSTMTLNATLLRNTLTASLSPFRSDSILNRNGGGSFATAIDAWRKWRLSVAVMPEGYPPNGSDWKEMCQGRIDRIDVANDLISITGRGEEAVLLDFWIATERQYGSVGGIAMETVEQSLWDNNLGSGVYTLSTPSSPGYLMNAWTQQKGNLFPASTDIAAKAGAIIRFRYDSSNVFRPTLFIPARGATPGSEVATIGPWEYTALPTVAVDKKGIRNFIKIRFVHPTLGTQTVISPWQVGVGTVSCTAGVATFSSSQAAFIKTTGSSTEIIVAGIPYTVTAFNGTTGATLLSQLATGGVPTFASSSFTLSDTVSGSGNGSTSSIDRFGRNDLEMDLSYTTQVNDPTKAQGMADAVRSDTELPMLEQEFETPGWWFIQLHDYIKLEANGVHYDSPQYGGVTSIKHDIANGTIKSTIGVRGKPAGAYANWRLLGSASVPSGGLAQLPYRDTTGLQMRARIVSQTSITATIRVAVADPYPQGPASASIIFTETGTAAATTPATGQTVAPESTLTEDAGTYVDFTVTRPTSTANAGRVAFTALANGRTAATASVDVPISYNGQGSIIPVSMALLPISYNVSGPATNRMSASFSWSALTAYRPDGTTVSVPASASYPTPPSPTLSQVVLGALGARTLFARIGYMKNNMIHRVGAEPAGFVVNANNVLKITSPVAVAGFDKWVPMVGSSASGEFIQIELPFGTDYQETSTGFNSTTTTPYNSNMDNAVTAQALPASTTVFWYPYYDIPFGFIAFASRGNTAKSEVDANVQNSDGHISFSPGASSVSIPAGGGSTAGTLSNSGGRFL